MMGNSKIKAQNTGANPVICVGAIYISPKSKHKKETIEHIIQMIHYLIKLEEKVHDLIGGDFNLVDISPILNSFISYQDYNKEVQYIRNSSHKHPRTVLSNIHLPSPPGRCG